MIHKETILQGMQAINKMLKNKQLLLVVNSIKLQLTFLKKPILTLVLYHSISNLLLIFRVTSFHLGSSYRYTVDTRQDDNKMLPLTLCLAFRSLVQPVCAHPLFSALIWSQSPIWCFTESWWHKMQSWYCNGAME